MGYRSVVGIMFKREKPQAPSVPEILALARTKGILEGDGLGKHWNDSECDDKKWQINFSVQHVKWYESYPDVQAMEKLFSFVEELSRESGDWYSGMFCRLGEQDDDTEQKSFGNDPWSGMWIVRNIGFESTELLGNQTTTELQTT